MADRQHVQEEEVSAFRRYNVYVIKLDAAVLEHRKFREQNPDWQAAKACLYVGMKALEPEARYEQHRKGYKSCRYVKHDHKWLRPRLCRRYNPMTYAEACAKERELARSLRAAGYAVWQP